MTPSLTGTSFIGYSRGAGTDPAGQGVAAATGAPLEPIYRAATQPELERACHLAASAFPAYAALPTRRRAGFLRAMALQIEALGDTLVQRMAAETALTVVRIQGERARTCAQLRMFADLIEEGSWIDARIDTALPDRQPLPKPDLRSMLRPIGPVAVFCAGNFPLAYAVAGGDTASALASGCPVIVKAHSGYPGTAELVGVAVAAAAQETGMPEGVFSLLYGAGSEVGQALVRHPAMAGVGFTGSRNGGQALIGLAQARPEPIPVYAEMSSVNPIFILPGALREKWGAIAIGLHNSVTAGVGQFCTKPGLVFVAAGREADQFITKLGTLFATTVACPMLSAGIADNFATRRSRLSSLPTVQTAAEGPDRQAGLFVTTARAFRENGILHGEVFGPVTLIILCDGEADFAACAEALEGQLTAAIHAEPADQKWAIPLMDILARKAGRLLHNSYPTGLEVCHATVHGGPFPATSDGRSTSVGTAAITRWTRAICYQNTPSQFLPPEIKNENPRHLWRLLNGQRTQAAVG